MHNIWDRNPSKSEVIGRCGGDEKNERQSRTLKDIAIYEYKANVFVHIKQLMIQLSHIIHSNQYAFKKTCHDRLHFVIQ